MKHEFFPIPIKHAAKAYTLSKSDCGEYVCALYDYFIEGKEHVFKDKGLQMLYDLSVTDIDELRAKEKDKSEKNANNARSKGKKSKTPKMKKSQDVAKVDIDSTYRATIDSNTAKGVTSDGSNGDGCSSKNDDGSAIDDSEPSSSNEDISTTEGGCLLREANNRNISVANSSVVTEPNTRNKAEELQQSVLVANDSNNCSDLLGNHNLANEFSDRNEINDSVTSLIDEDNGNGRSNSKGDDDVATSFAILRDSYGKTGNNESQAFELWKRLSAKDRAEALDYIKSIAGKSSFRNYLYVFLRDKEWQNT